MLRATLYFSSIVFQSSIIDFILVDGKETTLSMKRGLSQLGTPSVRSRFAPCLCPVVMTTPWRLLSQTSATLQRVEDHPGSCSHPDFCLVLGLEVKEDSVRPKHTTLRLVCCPQARRLSGSTSRQSRSASTHAFSTVLVWCRAIRSKKTASASTMLPNIGQAVSCRTRHITSFPSP